MTPRTARRRTPAGAVTVAVLSLTLTGCSVPPAPVPQPPPSTSTARVPGDPVPFPAGLDVEAGRSEEVVADPHYPQHGNPALDVLAYQLDLYYDPDAEEITGVATLTVRASSAVDELRLDFSATYQIDAVTVDGSPASYTRPSDDIAVGRPLAADARAVLQVRYQGTPQTVPMPSTRGDFAEGLGLRVTRQGELWTMQEPYGAFTWYPVNDHPSDEAVYDIRVTVPEGWSGVASGTFLGTSVDGELPAAGMGETFYWRSTDPVASYLTTLAIGEYTLIEDETDDGVPLTYWLRTGQDEGFGPVVRRSPELLDWLTERFGPYPFPSAGVVIVASESAMETQQMVTFGADRGFGSLDPQGSAETLLHEYAHMWFGDAVTPTDWTGLWLNEGWAMYCELLWIVDEGFGTLDEVFDWAYTIEAQTRPMTGPAGDFDPDTFGESNVYFGPALMLHAIHEQIGDEAFFALGRDWVQQRRNTQVDRAEFTAFVNEHTGRDFTALMNSWLDSPTMPPR